MKPKYKLGMLVKINDDGHEELGIVESVIQRSNGESYYRLSGSQTEWSESLVVGAFKPLTVRKPKSAKAKARKPKLEISKNEMAQDAIDHPAEMDL